jgi:hypothetical protein
MLLFAFLQMLGAEHEVAFGVGEGPAARLRLDRLIRLVIGPGRHPSPARQDRQQQNAAQPHESPHGAFLPVA